MNWYHWLIILIPLSVVLTIAFRSRKYVRDLSDFIAAGRVAGRYVISVAGVMDGLGVITLVGMCEANYQTGFAMSFWNHLLLPISVFLGITGYVSYRFRETRAMSGGQFLEMRYSRSFRIFATAIRVFAEMLTNCIGPAVAGRFFLYLLGVPHYITIAGVEVATFPLFLFCCVSLSLCIILNGGRISLIVADTFQGLISYPIFVILAVFVLTEFSWFNEIAPVMAHRIPGESFLNPYDIQNLRDFNMFALIVSLLYRFFNNYVWIGNDTSTAGRTPHEQKMAGILGTWRAGFSWLTCLLLVITVIVIMNHQNYADRANRIRQNLSMKVIDEVLHSQPDVRDAVKKDISAAAQSSNGDGRSLAPVYLDVNEIREDAPMPNSISTDSKQRNAAFAEIASCNKLDESGQMHRIALLGRDNNLDTPYYINVLNSLEQHMEVEGEGRQCFQQYRSLFNQMMLPMVMRDFFPPALLALFSLLMILLMISTDDSRIFNSGFTIVQDLIIPFCKTPPSPKTHLLMIRICSAAVGIIFFFASIFLSQLDFINLFLTVAVSIWSAGGAAVVIFGLYSRRGTTAGAYASVLLGGGISAIGIIIQRNWADAIYPFLERHDMLGPITKICNAVTSVFQPWIVWKMDPIKFPVNAMEISFIATIAGIIGYWVVSLLTCREPFNLDRLLHRGIYNLNPLKQDVENKFSWKRFFNYFVSITPDYTKGDKIIAWSVFVYSIIWQFLLSFVGITIWNHFAPISKAGWANYFLIVSLVVPCISGVITTVWFMWGGIVDLRRLFRDLASRESNALDNGMVEGNVALSDVAVFKAREEEARAKASQDKPAEPDQPKDNP